MNSLCPRCGAPLAPEANFCPQCGDKIKDPAPSTSIGTQIRVYFIALFIPPFGLWYAYKYIRYGGGTEKKIGYACLILTAVAIYLLIITTQAFINAMNQSLNSLSF